MKGVTRRWWTGRQSHEAQTGHGRPAPQRRVTLGNTAPPDADAIDPVPDIVLDLDHFSLARQQRDKDHLVYRSSEASGPQFSLVVVEPRTRAFNLGLHLRFEYAF